MPDIPIPEILREQDESLLPDDFWHDLQEGPPAALAGLPPPGAVSREIAPPPYTPGIAPSTVPVPTPQPAAGPAPRLAGMDVPAGLIVPPVRQPLTAASLLDPVMDQLLRKREEEIAGRMAEGPVMQAARGLFAAYGGRRYNPLDEMIQARGVRQKLESDMLAQYQKLADIRRNNLKEAHAQIKDLLVASPQDRDKLLPAAADLLVQTFAEQGIPIPASIWQLGRDAPATAISLLGFAADPILPLAIQDQILKDMHAIKDPDKARKHADTVVSAWVANIANRPEFGVAFRGWVEETALALKKGTKDNPVTDLDVRNAIFAARPDLRGMVGTRVIDAIITKYGPQLGVVGTDVAIAHQKREPPKRTLGDEVGRGLDEQMIATPTFLKWRNDLSAERGRQVTALEAWDAASGPQQYTFSKDALDLIQGRRLAQIAEEARLRNLAPARLDPQSRRADAEAITLLHHLDAIARVFGRFPEDWKPTGPYYGHPLTTFARNVFGNPTEAQQWIDAAIGEVEAMTKHALWGAALTKTEVQQGRRFVINSQMPAGQFIAALAMRRNSLAREIQTQRDAARAMRYEMGPLEEIPPVPENVARVLRAAGAAPGTEAPLPPELPKGARRR